MFVCMYVCLYVCTHVHEETITDRQTEGKRRERGVGVGGGWGACSGRAGPDLYTVAGIDDVPCSGRSGTGVLTSSNRRDNLRQQA